MGGTVSSARRIAQTGRVGPGSGCVCAPHRPDGAGSAWTASAIADGGRPEDNRVDTVIS